MATSASSSSTKSPSEHSEPHSENITAQKLEKTPAAGPLNWDGPNDPDNPWNWSSGKRWFGTIVPGCFCMLVYVPPCLLSRRKKMLNFLLTLNFAKMLEHLRHQFMFLAFMRLLPSSMFQLPWLYWGSRCMWWDLAWGRFFLFRFSFTEDSSTNLGGNAGQCSVRRYQR